MPMSDPAPSVPDELPENTERGMPNLALVRTDLANERTLLAYGRTAIMVVGTGVSVIKFFQPGPGLLAFGWFLIAAGGLIGAGGMLRFNRLRQRLRNVSQ